MLLMKTYLKIGLNNMKDNRYDINIYPLDCIYKAIQDYKNICNINITITEKDCILLFSNFLYDQDETILEFNNYLIDLIGAKNGF